MHKWVGPHPSPRTNSSAMKTYLLAACSMAALLATGCARVATTTSAELPTFTIAATGRVEVAPDEATFTLRSTCERDEASAANACLRARVDGLHALLADLGIPERDRQTLDVRLDPRYDYRDNRRVRTGFVASSGLRVTLRDLGLLDRVYGELLDDEDLQLEYMQYGHSRLDSLTREAHLRALDEAAALADALVGRAGASGKRLVGVSNSPQHRPGAQGGSRMYAAAEAMVQTAAAPPTMQSSAGLVEVVAQLWVGYAVE